MQHCYHILRAVGLNDVVLLKNAQILLSLTSCPLLLTPLQGREPSAPRAPGAWWPLTDQLISPKVSGQTTLTFRTVTSYTVQEEVVSEFPEGDLGLASTAGMLDHLPSRGAT